MMQSENSGNVKCLILAVSHRRPVRLGRSVLRLLSQCARLCLGSLTNYCVILIIITNLTSEASAYFKFLIYTQTCFLADI